MEVTKTEGLNSQEIKGENNLQKKLENRHIQLIAIGGAIGTGLFMGAGKSIHLSGSSIILTYMIVGFFYVFGDASIRGAVTFKR